jgi:hypothetical protein
MSNSDFRLGFILFIFFLVNSVPVYSDPIKLSVGQNGSTNETGTMLTHVINRSDNGYYVAGLSYDDQVEIGGKVFPGDGGLYFVAKLDGAGQLLWLQRMRYMAVREIKLAPDGGMLIGGHGQYGDMELGGAATLVKINDQGGIVWEKRYWGKDANASIHSIAVDKFGEIVIVGMFSQADLEYPKLSKVSSKFNSDIFMARLSEAGEPVWARAFGGERSNYDSLHVGQDSDLSSVLVGSFWNNNITNPYIPLQGSVDGFMLKVDRGGSVLWGRSFGGCKSKSGISAGNIKPKGIVITQDNEIGVNGNFTFVGICEPGDRFVKTTWGSGSFLAKFRGDSSIIWANGYDLLDASSQLIVDKDSNIFFGGGVKAGDAEINKTLLGKQDAFLLRTNGSGKITWSAILGGNLSEASVLSVAVNKSGELVSTGYFENSDLTSPPLKLKGYRDGFIVSSLLPASPGGGSGSYKEVILSTSSESIVLGERLSISVNYNGFSKSLPISVMYAKHNQNYRSIKSMKTNTSGKSQFTWKPIKSQLTHGGNLMACIKVKSKETVCSKQIPVSIIKY